MTEITGEALGIAGFALAQAVSSVCDTGTEKVLAPFAIVEATDGARHLTQYEAATPAEAIEKAKGDYAINSATSDAWACAREDTYRIIDSEEAGDVIAVDFWSKGMPYVASLMQRFTRAVDGTRFRLVGVPSIIDDGVPLDADEGALMVERVKQGIGEHPEAERLWRYWE
jgi:hypothetical protein